MSAVSQLLAYGVDGPSLSEKLLEEMTFPQMKVLTKALQTLTMSEDGKVAWVVVSPDDMTECGAVNEDLEGIVNYPRNIRGVEVGIFFKVINDQAVKVQLEIGRECRCSRAGSIIWRRWTCTCGWLSARG